MATVLIKTNLKLQVAHYTHETLSFLNVKEDKAVRNPRRTHKKRNSKGALLEYVQFSKYSRKPERKRERKYAALP